jgi:uncharacterized protein (DUF2225 family)
MADKNSFGPLRDVPFTFFSLECPVCGQVNEYKKIKSGAFVETKIDTDFCPQERIWIFPENQNLHPYLFLLLTCEKCFFTREAETEFLEWKKDEIFTTQILPVQKQRHMQFCRDKNHLIFQLGTNLDVTNYPQQSIIIKLLLAIADEKLKDDPADFKIARLCLMMAWVFREQEQPTYSGASTPQSNSLNKQLKSFFEAQQNYSEQLRKVKKELESKSVPKSISSGQNEPEELKKRCLKWIEETQATFDFLNHWLGKLENLVSQEKMSKNKINPLTNLFTKKYKNYPNFIDYLKKLKEIHSEIALSEKEALELALVNYKNSFQGIDILGKEIQKAQTGYLIGELSRRIGDTSTARQFFDFSIKQTQELLQDEINIDYNVALAQKINQLAQQQKNLLT